MSAITKVGGFNVDPARPYDGPDFDEYCISAKAYLPASRDRTPCVTCPLGNLCDAGFREQVRLVAAGENPSLTECKIFVDDGLAKDRLLADLSREQRAFVLHHVFNEPEEGDHGKANECVSATGEETARREGGEAG